MDKTANVVSWLFESAEKYGDKIAYADQSEQITYSELLHETTALGNVLSQKLNTTRTPIVVLVDRSVTSVVNMLSVVLSKNFYVPLDSEMPMERLTSLIGQIKPAAVLSCTDDIDLGEGYPELPRYTRARLNAEAEATEPSAIDCHAYDDVLPSDPLYAICTSGSTGVPKIVLKAHRSILSFIPVFAETFGFDDHESFANQAPFDFDVSAKDIYTTLYCGATMHVVDSAMFVMPKTLGSYLDERNITTCIWAVSALSVLAQFNAFKREKPSLLRKILFSGEVMPPKHLAKWMSWYPDAMFVNLYAPTEVTGNCMYYVVDGTEADNRPLPLGKSFTCNDVLIIGKDGQPIRQAGDTGEIYVRGENIALGYYQDSERTQKVFLQNPVNSSWPERVYRTGDLARLDDDGKIYFAGREDFQIKHMGHRIELEELELNIMAVEGIERACCIFNLTTNKIVAFYEGDVTVPELVKELKQRLPKYMVPNVFQKLEHLPISKRGKVDRAYLRSLLEK